VTDIHKALDPDSVNADALKTGAKAILDMKHEIVTTKALVAQFQRDAAKAVSDDPSTANALNLEKTKNLTLQSNLATAQDQLQSANDRIRSLNASTATLQDRLDRAVARMDQLETDKSTGSAVVRTVDIDGRVSRLLDELQNIIGEIPRRDVGDAVQRTSEYLLHCIPDERLQRNFVKQLVLKLQSNIDPTSKSLRLMIDSLRRDSVQPTARREGEAVDEEY
jgi:chromosome segregation ATPase